MLQPSNDNSSAAYLDDVILYSDSSQLGGTPQTPQKFSEARRGRPQSQGIEVLWAKTRWNQSFSGPLRTKKSVRAFNYICFIPNFADTAGPPSDLIKASPSNKVRWTPDFDRAFPTLKKSLMNKPVLRNRDFQKSFMLQTDVSDVGLVAVLSNL